MTTRIRVRTEVGADRKLHIQLPDDAPIGPVDVDLAIERTPPDDRDKAILTERRAAARAGRGMLRGMGFTLDDFRKERMEEDAARDRALGM